MPQELCAPVVQEGITAARESVEQYLRNTFEEIARLQETKEFLQNVDEIQARTDDVNTWQVQREQLAAVEECAESCTCEDGARLAVDEYNALVGRQPEASGLVRVPVAAPVTSQLGMLVIVAVVVLAAYFLARRGRR